MTLYDNDRLKYDNEVDKIAQYDNDDKVMIDW